jgi:hypothetical protein
MVCRTSLQATVTTVGVLIALTIGHWFIWLICGPLMMFRGPNDVGETILKMQAGITPPIALGFFAFMSTDFNRGPNEMAEMIGFGIVGTLLWAMAGFFLWFGVLTPKFRAMTRRTERFQAEAADSDYRPARRADSDRQCEHITSLRPLVGRPQDQALADETEEVADAEDADEDRA